MAKVFRQHFKMLERNQRGKGEAWRMWNENWALEEEILQISAVGTFLCVESRPAEKNMRAHHSPRHLANVTPWRDKRTASPRTLQDFLSNNRVLNSTLSWEHGQQDVVWSHPGIKYRWLHLPTYGWVSPDPGSMQRRGPDINVLEMKRAETRGQEQRLLYTQKAEDITRIKE